VLPVIHAAAPKVTVIEGKPKFPDEVEVAMGEGAEPPDVAGILGNLRFVKDQVQAARAHGWGSKVVLDGALSFAEIHFFSQVIPLVILLFTATKSDFDLDQPFDKIEPQRNEGTTAALDGLLKFPDFLFMKEEFPRSIRVVIGAGPKGVPGNMGMVKDRNTFVYADKGLVDLDRSLPDGFHFRAAEDNAGLDGFIDEIVPTGTGVPYLLETVLLFFSTHRGLGNKKTALGVKAVASGIRSVRAVRL
jgi:hypothetical protein